RVGGWSGVRLCGPFAGSANHLYLKWKPYPSHSASLAAFHLITDQLHVICPFKSSTAVPPGPRSQPNGAINNITSCLPFHSENETISVCPLSHAVSVSPPTNSLLTVTRIRSGFDPAGGG